MEYNEDFARLEQFVERLIDSYNQLKNENSEINEQLLAKEQEVGDLQETIKNLQDDRGVMHNRISGLIARIDEWEKILASEGSDKNSKSAGAGKKTKHGKKSSSLFNASAEQSSGTALR